MIVFTWPWRILLWDTKCRIYRYLKHMSYKASLSIQNVWLLFSTSWWTDNVALYGSTTVSDTLGDGITLKGFISLSGYSSLILDRSNVPIPDPVPPPKLCASWNPWRQSLVSASFRTTSNTESTSSAPIKKLLNVFWRLNFHFPKLGAPSENL